MPSWNESQSVCTEFLLLFTYKRTFVVIGTPNRSIDGEKDSVMVEIVMNSIIDCSLALSLNIAY